MVVTGLRLAPQATPAAVYIVVVVVGTGVMGLTTIKPVWIIAVAAGIGLLMK